MSPVCQLPVGCVEREVAVVVSCWAGRSNTQVTASSYLQPLQIGFRLEILQPIIDAIHLFGGVFLRQQRKPFAHFLAPQWAGWCATKLSHPLGKNPYASHRKT